MSVGSPRSATKSYDYLLKFLLVGDSDVGKEEMLSGLLDGASESPFFGLSAGTCFYSGFHGTILKFLQLVKFCLKVDIPI